MTYMQFFLNHFDFKERSVATGDFETASLYLLKSTLPILNELSCVNFYLPVRDPIYEQTHKTLSIPQSIRRTYTFPKLNVFCSS